MSGYPGPPGDGDGWPTQPVEPPRLYAVPDRPPMTAANVGALAWLTTVAGVVLVAAYWATSAPFAVILVGGTALLAGAVLRNRARTLRRLAQGRRVILVDLTAEEGPELPADMPPCVCGCPAGPHNHYRRGTDCGFCGAEICPAYRPA